MEVLVEAAEGKYEFDGGSKEIETEDLSELSAAYLQKDLSENDSGLRESSNAAFICEWDTDGNGNILTPVPGQETENKELTLEVYLPKVIKPLETYEVSGIEGLYEALEPNTRSITSPDFEEKIALQEEMQVWFNYIADTYVLGEGAIKDAAETVYGKEVVITCEGFYSEDDNDLLYPLDDPRTFEEFGVDDSYLTLYPVYTVHIPGEEVSDRYVSLRLMIEEDVDYNFYTFMVQSGTDLGLPKVEGYDMYWLVGSDKTEEPRQRIEEDRLSWPILQAEKQ